MEVVMEAKRVGLDLLTLPPIPPTHCNHFTFQSSNHSSNTSGNTKTFGFLTIWISQQQSRP
jgi:hypothetical protein